MPELVQIQKKAQSGQMIAAKKPEQAPLSSAVNPYLSLQALGNQALQQMLRSGDIKAKLKIGEPDDEYEREADRLANQIMDMTEPESQQPIQCQSQEEDEIRQKSLASFITPLVQLQSPLDKKKERKGDIQAKPSQQAAKVELESNEDLENSLSRSKRKGRHLPYEIRAFVEPRIQFDFSEVKVHTDNEAIRMNRELGARAFTHGQDIYFGAGQYNLSSQEGKRLVAHELMHVVQQSPPGTNILAKALPIQNTVRSDTIQLSPLSEELEEVWLFQGQEVFFSQLSQVQGVGDPDVADFVEETLTGDDLLRARQILGIPLAAERTSEPETPEGRSATGGIEGGQIVMMTYRGRRIMGTMDELRQFTANQIRALDSRIYGISYAHQSFVRRTRYSPVRWICDLPANLTDLMGVTSRTLPDVAMWEVPRQLLAQARTSYESGDYEVALRQLGFAAQVYNGHAARWFSYIRGTTVRAQDVATGLEVFSSVSISIGVTVLTAGSGALVSAGVAGGVMAIRELGRETAELALDVDPEFNVERFSTEVLTSAASNFVGGVLQGPLQNTFARLFPRYIRHIRDLGPINQILREAGASQVTRASLQSWTQRYIGVLMARIPINTLNDVAIEVYREFAESGATPSEESLLERFADRLAYSMSADVIARAIIESTVQ